MEMQISLTIVFCTNQSKLKTSQLVFYLVSIITGYIGKNVYFQRIHGGPRGEKDEVHLASDVFSSKHSFVME